LTTPAKGAKLISSTKSFLITDGKSGENHRGFRKLVQPTVWAVFDEYLIRYCPFLLKGRLL